MVKDVGFIAAITTVLVSSSIERGTTGTSDRKDALGEIQRVIRRLLLLQPSSARWLSSSKVSFLFFVSLRLGVRLCAGKVYFALEIYRTAAIHCNVPHHDMVREVLYPSKDRKVKKVALRHHIDPTKFQRVGRQLRRVRPLLP
jgi:hypothetical protein